MNWRPAKVQGRGHEETITAAQKEKKKKKDDEDATHGSSTGEGQEGTGN